MGGGERELSGVRKAKEEKLMEKTKEEMDTDPVTKQRQGERRVTVTSAKRKGEQGSSVDWKVYLLSHYAQPPQAACSSRVLKHLHSHPCFFLEN